MKFVSRKFIVTLIVTLTTFLLAKAGKMDSDVALILTAVVASYNAAQGYIDAK